MNCATTLARLYLEMHDRDEYVAIVDDANLLYQEMIDRPREIRRLSDFEYERAFFGIQDDLISRLKHYFNSTSFSDDLLNAVEFEDWAIEVMELIEKNSGYYRPSQISPQSVLKAHPPQKQILYSYTRLKTPSDPGGLVGNGTSGLATSPLH